ncbi:MAG: ATP-binding protein, partial [Candidatus Thorarchaeota archaeon]
GSMLKDARKKTTHIIALLRDITEQKKADESLRAIEWLLSKGPGPVPSTDSFRPPYGDLTKLNTSGLLAGSIEKDILTNIVNSYLVLQGTSAAVYEKNGDYALGIFSSGWCQLLDTASRACCNTDDNRAALESGKWLCHESCWTEASKVSIETGQPVDIECNGGIHLYAVPIRVGGEMVGSINFGYGDPPKDPAKLEEIANKYNVTVEELLDKADEYDSRPRFVIEDAKKRLESSAMLICALVERKRAEKELHQLNEELEDRVMARTKELREAQEALVQNERLATLGQLGAGIGHELRNPLGAIKNAAYFLQMVFEKPAPEVKETIDIIAKEVATSERIISSLLSYARPKPATRRKVNINDVIVEALSASSLPETVEVVSQLDEGIPTMLADPDQLRQVFVNLILNALQAMPKGGRLIVKSWSPRPDSVNVSIADTGVGIPQADLDKIFKPLFTTKAKGIGLGLAIVKTLVDGHDGTIDVQSEPDKGTTFTVRIPVVLREAE